MIDRAGFETQQHFEELFERYGEGVSAFSKFVAKYNGERLIGARKPHYQRITDSQVSSTDPDASPMHSFGGGSAVLVYRDHYVVDGGKERIIENVLPDALAQLG